MSPNKQLEELKALGEEVQQLEEKNVPTNPSKWAYYKAQAKKKFDVYPSAYANGWAAKQYKKAGGGWKSESVNEVDVKKKINRRGDVDGLLVQHNGKEYHIVYSGDFGISSTVMPYGIVMPGDDTVSFLSKDRNAKTIWKQLKPKVDKFLKSNESVNEASVSDFEIGDFVHFKSKNKTGMVVSIKGNKVTINTPKGKITSDVKDVKVLHQDNVNEVVIKEAAKLKLGKDSVSFKVMGDKGGLTILPATGNDLDKVQDAIANDIDVKEELRKSLEKQLKVPVETERGYEGGGFRFIIDFYSLAKQVK